MKTFERLESEVRGYCRAFPTIFERAMGSELFDVEGRRYVDFFAGAGVINYGHNNPRIRDALVEYLQQSGIVHGLDMATSAKKIFLESFDEIVLRPRGMSYKMQFTGPTGTNAVEAALKLARKVTGRRNVVAFTNAFHGMTLGALAVTGSEAKRAGAGVNLPSVARCPYDGYAAGTNSLELLEQLIGDPSSGIDKPAAVIVETVQAEGGVNVASIEWLRGLRELTRRHDVLLIVDDIQVGCGRTGKFFSFETSNIEPDMVCLSKALSGFGMPMAMVLIRPELDLWQPGEHNGTFRGFNPAFVTATAALSLYWRTADLEAEVARRARLVRQRLDAIAEEFAGECLEVRSRGLIQGLQLKPRLAGKISRAAFDLGLVIETSGPRDEVLKILPPLTTNDALLEEGLDILHAAIATVTSSWPRPTPAGAVEVLANDR